MKLDFEFACDQLNSTNHSLLLELSSSASCQHILTMCIRSCTYMDTLPLIAHFMSKREERKKGTKCEENWEWEGNNFPDRFFPSLSPIPLEKVDLRCPLINKPLSILCVKDSCTAKFTLGKKIQHCAALMHG